LKEPKKAPVGTVSITLTPSLLLVKSIEIAAKINCLRLSGNNILDVKGTASVV
jgi:hypothetical protein